MLLLPQKLVRLNCSILLRLGVPVFYRLHVTAGQRRSAIAPDSERVLTLLDRWWRNPLTRLQSYCPNALATLCLLLQPAGTRNNLSMLPAPCPATSAPLFVILPSYTAMTTQSSVTAIIHVLLDWHSLAHHALRLTNVGTLPRSLSQSTSDWVGPVLPCFFLCHFGGVSLCAFQLLHEVPFPAPNFFHLSQELLIGIGCNFSSRTLGPTVGPVAHEEKVGGCRGCV
jgi:hypothetical protein